MNFSEMPVSASFYGIEKWKNPMSKLSSLSEEESLKQEPKSYLKVGRQEKLHKEQN